MRDDDVSGHKCETSLQSYWYPKLGDQRRWKNIFVAKEKCMLSTCLLDSLAPETYIEAKG